MLKERTLRGVHEGVHLAIGNGEAVTIWDGLLLLARPVVSPLIRQWRGRYLVGGTFWVEVPHSFTNDPKTMLLYPDTWMNRVTKPIRRWLLPGSRLRRWLDG